ncbi:ABC transporter permease [Trebonia sp.]|jgi:peptide/nickel transport system permease protein|uniref:ABC transporter permease n=1 Tax=Trebonia sp. TaxID=2767075 RepID=UPI003BB211E8
MTRTTRTTRRPPHSSVLRLPSARIAVAILAVILFLAIFGSALAPQSPLAIDAGALYKGPSLHHLLGTDYLGRDVLSRLMAGTRLSVLTAFEAVGIGLVIGAPLGVATVFLGRWFDFTANRVADALMTLPSIFFAVAVTAALGNGLVQAMFPVGILLIPGFYRVTRAATLEFGRAQYVEAAELLGGSKLHVIRVHVLRKVLPTIAVTTATAAAGALLAVSFLTFLGIGVQPPTPTWGGVLSSDLDYLNLAPWAPFIPGALIAITVGALNALADAYRDRAGAGALLSPVADPVIKTHSTLQALEAADDRQTAA